MRSVKTILLALAVLCAPSWLAAQTYTVVQFSGYQSAGSSDATSQTTTLASDQTSGNVNLVEIGSCATSGCSTAGVYSTYAFSDNAGSDGGSGNNSYAVDQGVSSNSLPYAVVLGHAFGVTHTTSTLTVTGSVSGYTAYCGFACMSYPSMGAIEVNGLGASPSLDSSGQAAQSSGSTMTLSTAGSCSANDFAWLNINSGAQPTVPSGWTAIGTPADNQLIAWQKVASSGTVSISLSGLSGVTGAAVACYTPSSASPTLTRHRVIIR